MKHTSSNASRGFTLIEVMTAIAVLTVGMSIAVPSYREFTARQKIRMASFDMNTDLLLARSEALKRNRTISVMPREANWANGWIITVQGSAEEVRTRNALAHGMVVSGSAAGIAFNGSGRVVANDVESIGLSIDVGSVLLERCVVLDPAGRPRVLEEACP